VGSTSITAVIPGCAARRRTGIHNHGLGLWIPGSRFARPGMTTVDVVASDDAKLALYILSCPAIFHWTMKSQLHRRINVEKNMPA